MDDGDVTPTLYDVHAKEYIALNNAAFSIGRGLYCNHVLTCIGVSRQHCIFKKQGHKWILFDKSMNGTRVNGHLIKDNEFVDLKSGDVIYLAPEIEYVFLENQQEVGTVEDMPKDLVVVDSTLENATGAEAEDESVVVLLDEASSSDHELEESKEKDTTTDSGGDVVKAEATDESKKEEAKADTVTSNAMEDELTCSICSELFVKAVTLTCSHTYCNFCITEWRKSKSACPICRAHITAMSPTLVLDNYIAKIIESQSEEIRNARSELVQQRTMPGITAGPSTSSASGLSTASTSTAANGIIEISEEEDLDEEEDDMDDDGDYHHHRYDSYYDSFDDYDEDEDGDGSDIDYNGTPGVYYGGYGRCYSCGQRGHWANGCPLKRR